ncbi:hypothetical protein GCM10010464_01970 [Pseudonocardia yunnanensis]
MPQWCFYARCGLLALIFPLLTVTQRLRNGMIFVAAGSDAGTQRCTGRKIRMAARHSLLLEQDLNSLSPEPPENGDDLDIVAADRGVQRVPRLLVVAAPLGTTHGE